MTPKGTAYHAVSAQCKGLVWIMCKRVIEGESGGGGGEGREGGREKAREQG